MSDSIIVDRRSGGTSSSVQGSKQKYKQRIKQQLQDAVNRAVNKRKVGQVDKKGVRVNGRTDAVSEPTIVHDPSAEQEHVVVGNDRFKTGDSDIEHYQGGGMGNGAGNGDDVVDDEFIYQLNKDELRQILFEGLSLPNFVRKVSNNSKIKELKRAGFTRTGNPATLNVMRSYKQSLCRRIAIRSSIDKKIKKLIEISTDVESPDYTGAHDWIDDEIYDLEKKRKKVPLFEEIDLRYVHKELVNKPVTKAVMYCLMDVSGSMDEERKALGKWFFVLLNLFLTQCYDHVEIIFVRHHTEAEIVDEETFFYKRESGGTIVSKGLQLILDDINKNHDPAKENIYVAQVSDGENWNSDNMDCIQLIKNQLLEKLQYMCYLEVKGSTANYLSQYYHHKLVGHPKFKMGGAQDKDEVYLVFRNFFS
jgi:uncharacterized sporulation protein YeaH/YhbH (DUF444 family)